MPLDTKNKNLHIIQLVAKTDAQEISNYLQRLSAATKKRFAPHPDDSNAIEDLYLSSKHFIGYIVRTANDQQIIAYAIVKIGCIEHDLPRLASYRLQLNPFSDCSFAPSIADEWQGKGIGNILLNYIKNDLTTKGIRRIFLWGGVQKSNEGALKYYKRNGFYILGEFSFQVVNIDMLLTLN